MGNPYFIPRKSITPAVNSFSGALAKQKELAQTALTEKEKLAQRRSELDFQKTTQQENLKVKQRTATVAEGRLEYDKGKTQKALAINEMPMKPEEVTKMRTNIASFDKNNKTKLGSIIGPVFNWVDEQAASGVNKVDIYKGLKSMWKGKKTQVSEELQKEILKARESGNKDLEEKLTWLDGRVKDGQLVDGMMPMASAFVEEENAKRKEQPRWQPFTDDYGNRVLRNQFGDEKKISGPTKGMEITTADGTTIRTGVTQGSNADIPLDKVNTRKLQDKLIEISDDIARMEDIETKFQPQFLTIDTKMDSWWTDFKGKLQGSKVADWFGLGVSKDEKEQADAFWKFKRTSLEDISLYIKRITGAQMSEPEADRLKAGRPDPGTGILDGDGPDQFKSKMNDTLYTSRMTQARTIYLLTKGGWSLAEFEKNRKADTLPSIKNMERKISSRMDDLESRGMDAATIKQTINQEFFTYAP